MLESDIKRYCSEIYPDLKYHYVLLTDSNILVNNTWPPKFLSVTVKLSESVGTDRAIHIISIKEEKLIKYFRKQKLNKMLK